MTTIIDHGQRSRRSSSIQSVALDALFGAARWVAALVAAEIDRRRTMALLELDDRMLTDMGVTRGDIHGALTSAPGEKPSSLLAEVRLGRRTAERAQGREARAGRFGAN
ncbi:DUF1127 domain-containing protein [Chthonobacter albigriseus]|uniref:DUF1127 domain-containing protein n=1 Tax=Chthonobacter albigriseus TaxID=1683161 RepID=UPI0015EF8E4E|nr:DUF1127 domain-containing protein [Chthonobacter albigriseus]